jgi:hypothetical protein
MRIKWVNACDVMRFECPFYICQIAYVILSWGICMLHYEYSTHLPNSSLLSSDI